jgi:hypothetical protein
MRARLLAAALASGVLVAAASSPARAASDHAATTPTARTAGSGTAGPTNLQAQELAYSKCMRANGVPNFPDPSPGGGWNFRAGSGIDQSSPLFKRAQAKCQKLLPNGGAGPAFNAQAGPQLLKIASCMRHHGIPDFPDPTRAPGNGSLSSLPHKPGIGMITDYQGWLLEFPSTINTQSPAYTRALAACHASFLTGQH